jgi:hypothetical protein
LIGAGILSASIVVIGGAVAGATWMLGAALPTFAEGMKSFEEIDGDALIKTGLGIGAIGVALAAFGAGSAVEGIGAFVDGIVGGIGRLFGADDPMEKLKAFAEYDIDAEKVRSNALALTAMSGALAAAGGASAVEGIGAFIDGIVGGLGRLFGATDPMQKLKDFANYDIDVGKVMQNSNALRSFATALSGFGDVKMGELDLPYRFTNNLTTLLKTKGTGEGLAVVTSNLKEIAGIVGIEDRLTAINSSFDFDNVKNYASAISDLTKNLEDLNKELAKSNDTLFQEKLSAGELLQDVGVTNRLTSEKVETLNTTLVEILNILKENKEIDLRIEKNTKGIGSNLAQGSISSMR